MEIKRYKGVVLGAEVGKMLGGGGGWSRRRRACALSMWNYLTLPINSCNNIITYF